MASAFAHAVAATAIGSSLGVPWHLWRILVLGMACSVLPDLDLIGFWLGIPYEHPLGHRGLSHSIAFAAVLSAVILRVVYRDASTVERRRLGWFFFLATCSHGVLDAMTNGGLGVAFFAPVDNTRYFFPFRPIEVSPLDPHRFFAPRGLTVLMTEVVWVGIPALLAILGVAAVRQLGREALPHGVAIKPVPVRIPDDSAESGEGRVSGPPN
ncbi:metal-dependent hydrolase [Petrachloros mirabilis]